ncbi:MAG TPA: hypothetical protein VHE13_03380 [Opitutus sp.]|nr:hypothetical protein [Opitutus sp.]
MNSIRAAFTTFFLAILVFALLGWHWSVALPADKMMGARFVLALIAVSSVTALVLIWREKAARVH